MAPRLRNSCAQELTRDPLSFDACDETAAATAAEWIADNR
jgi:hypothetical protein